MAEDEQPPTLREVLGGGGDVTGPTGTRHATPLELDAPRAPAHRPARKRATTSPATTLGVEGFDGDIRASGPLPPLGMILGPVASYVFLAAGSAVLVAGIASKVLSASYGQIDPEAGTFGFGAAAATAGFHPLVGGLWIAWICVGLGIAHAAEKKTRSVWPALPILLVVGALPDLVPTASWEQLAEVTAFGLLDGPLVELALVNLPHRWWLIGLTMGFVWVGGRRNDPLLMTAALIGAGFATWELDVARLEIWGTAVDQVFDAAAQASPMVANRPDVRTGFRNSELVMHARALSDLLLLLGPVLVVRTLTNRALGAYGGANWRLLQQA